MQKIWQQERDRLLAEIENRAANDGQTQKAQDSHSHKLKALEAQVSYVALNISFCYHTLLIHFNFCR